MFLDQYESVQWTALNYLVAEVSSFINYFKLITNFRLTMADALPMIRTES